jgi:DNA-directed RNA polymerase II subunit RPB1
MHKLPISSIDKIQFQIYGNNEIKSSSVITEPDGINIPEIYNNNTIKKNGLGDLRLGVIENNMYCDTCGQSSLDCPGHFGHLKLVEPVFHYGFLDIVKNILSCVCIRCCKLLINKNEEEIIKLVQNSVQKARFYQIKKLLSNVKYCQRPDQNCGAPIPDITRSDEKKGEIFLIATWNIDKVEMQEDQKTPKNIVLSSNAKLSAKKITDVLTPLRVYNILKNISDNDYRIMGFDPKLSRLDNLIIEYFPIPPMTIRPNYKLGGSTGHSSEDSLTGKLADIIKADKSLRNHLKTTLTNVDNIQFNQQHLHLLQYHVGTYFDNETMKLPKSQQKGSNKPFLAITSRLKGKHGRIRQNLMGKRVNFSARTVITSDPNLGLNELGVPIKIAMNLTFPEVVTAYNIDKLTELVRNGSNEYPGANYIILNKYNKGTSDSLNKELTKIDLKYFKKSVKLSIGDIVERHLMDGDPVLFNRQPTLHKMSMMCHFVKVIKNPNLCTFRLNVTVTTPYNADQLSN